MRKRGQEEIVGFVLIMVVVAVIVLILLGISIRNPSSSSRDSKEIYQFLESSFEYTTECQIRSSPEYGNLGELSRKCLDKESCLNDLDSCDVFEKAIKGVLDSSWNVGNESKIRGYRFLSVYESSSSKDANKEEILVVEKGSCTGNKIGSSYLIPEFPGKISNILEICY